MPTTLIWPLSAGKSLPEFAPDRETPQDVLATLYHHLGVDVAAQYPNGTGRPISVLPVGKAIGELF